MNEAEDLTLRALSVSLGALSCLFCAIIITISLFKRTGSSSNPSSNTSSTKMILYLTLSDLFLAVVSVSAYYPNDQTRCKWNAIMSTFFGTSSFMWTLCMSHFSYTSVSQLFNNWGGGARRFGSSMVLPQGGGSNHVEVQSNQSWMLRYHILSWGISLVATIIMLSTNSAGPNLGTSCWIVTSSSTFSSPMSSSSLLPLWAATIIYLIPLLLIEAYNAYVFQFLAKTLKHIPAGEDLLSRFTRYLSINLGIKAIFFLARAISLFVPIESADTAFSLYAFVLISMPLQGVGDFAIFRDKSLTDGLTAENRYMSGNRRASMSQLMGGRKVEPVNMRQASSNAGCVEIEMTRSPLSVNSDNGDENPSNKVGGSASGSNVHKPGAYTIVGDDDDSDEDTKIDVSVIPI